MWREWAPPPGPLPAQTACGEGRKGGFYLTGMQHWVTQDDKSRCFLSTVKSLVFLRERTPGTSGSTGACARPKDLAGTPEGLDRNSEASPDVAES